MGNVLVKFKLEDYKTMLTCSRLVLIGLFKIKLQPFSRRINDQNFSFYKEISESKMKRKCWNYLDSN